MTDPTLSDQLQLLHDLLYTAQTTRSHEQHEAITRARVLLSHIRTELATQQPAPADSATVAACIARLEQGGQSAAVAILRHHFQ